MRCNNMGIVQFLGTCCDAVVAIKRLASNPLHLLEREELVLRIPAEQNSRLPDHLVRRHWKVARGDPRISAPCGIVMRIATRANITPGHIENRSIGEIARNASAFRAKTDQDCESRIDRPMPILRISRLLVLLRISIEELRNECRLSHGIQHRGRSPDHENREATPAHQPLLSGQQVDQIYLNDIAGCQDLGIRIHLVDQRPRGRNKARSAYGRGRGVEEVATIDHRPRG